MLLLPVSQSKCHLNPYAQLPSISHSFIRSPGADETQLSLELLREECGIDCSLVTPIEQEANELIAIFTTIIRRTGAK